MPEQAKQAEEAERRRERWGWAEPTVWTDRLVAALEHGVKGGRWYSLLDTGCAERTLAAAWERVKRNGGSAGVDWQRVQAFAARAATYLAEPWQSERGSPQGAVRSPGWANRYRNPLDGRLAEHRSQLVR